VLSDSVGQLLIDVGKAEILPRFEHLAQHEIGEKGPRDLVTIADVEAERSLSAALQTSYPEACIVGEEAVDQDASLTEAIDSHPHVWLIDPLDGTGNFVSGIPDFGMMLCELKFGSPTRSWIWQPLYEVMYFAERLSGAWRNGERLRTPEPDMARLNGASSEAYMGLAGSSDMDVVAMRRSCSVDYPRIAEGLSDFLIHNGRHPWDHYPGLLLLEELGGVVRFADGEPFTSAPRSPFRLVAAANERVWSLVSEAMLALPLPPPEAPE
jgi:fructose-1,6-bisphosphatase/inositol monophosphatase family enzyme